MLKKTTLLLSLFAILLLNSCGNSNDAEPTTIVGTWQLSSVTFDINGEILTATSAAMEDAELKDNQWIFDENGNVTFLPDNFSVDYTFNAADNKLVITADGAAYNYTTELTNSDLKVKSKVLDAENADDDTYENDLEAAEILFSALDLLEDQQDALERIGDVKKISLTYQFVKLK